jgi:hypothetical protein
MSRQKARTASVGFERWIGCTVTGIPKPVQRNNAGDPMRQVLAAVLFCIGCGLGIAFEMLVVFGFENAFGTHLRPAGLGWIVGPLGLGALMAGSAREILARLRAADVPQSRRHDQNNNQTIDPKTEAEFEACKNAIAQKWLLYNNVLQFRPEVPLAERIERFLIPMNGFVRINYPAAHSLGPRVVQSLTFSGIQRSGNPSMQEINQAILYIIGTTPNRTSQSAPR